MKKITILLSIVATMFFSLPMYSVSVWDGTADIWTAGTGTESDPYQIVTAQQLAFVAEMVNGGVTTYQNKYFVLNDEIDLSDLEWTPIGSYDYKFEATFNGNGHTISGLRVSAERTYNGLFGYSTALIENLTVNGSISNGQYSGGITAYSTGGIDNCSFVGDVSANQSRPHAGGIIGCLGESLSSPLKITNCRNSGTVSVTDSSGSESTTSISSGGIIGCLSGSSSSSVIIVTNCWNSGAILTTNSSASAYLYAGGIIGCLDGSLSSSIAITNCENSGTVSVTAIKSYNSCCAGGIVGFASPLSLSITNCSNIGTIYSSSEASGIACCYYIKMEINYCYNRGLIEGKTAYGISISPNNISNSYNVGSLNGVTKNYGIGNYTLTNCYYLESCGATEGGISKTESAMKSVSFPIVLNGGSEAVFTQDVNKTNDGYPILAWQIDNAPVVVVSCNPSQGSTSGSGSYVSGSSATISATPNSGYIFAGWNDGDTTNPRTITVTGNAHYVALFEQAVINIKVGQDCTITQE